MPARWLAAAGLLIVSLALMHPTAQAQTAAGERAVVLDTAGFWRMHDTLSRPVMQVDGTLKTIPYFDPKARGQEGELRMWQDTLLAEPTASPAGDWKKPEFDDGSWVRDPA